MRSFTIGQKQIDVFPGAEPGSPVVYLNTYGREGAQVLRLLQESGCRDLSLVAVSGLAWNHDMAPWDIPPISANDTPCTGGAGAYLRLLLEKIMPEAEDALPGKPVWRGIAGYSLAGLFAVYAVYQTDVFSRVGSISGSLWFPGIREYIFSHTLCRKPDCMYFSLGDKESRTRNPFLKCVQENTEAIRTFYERQGINTAFQLNPGNHFKDGALRTAAGIQWIVDQKKE
ncbi:MAG: alpha/beta hydrolase [Blautia massiliensis (ex Durand et al. 2017)]